MIVLSKPLFYVKTENITKFEKRLSKSLCHCEKQIMVSSILPKYKQKNLTSGIIADRNILFLHSFFGRIEDTINCFQDLLTFSKVVSITYYKSSQSI